MVRITEELVRKRAEHNECLISTLEEISLHQQDIERIEYLDKWCKELRILYLQSNLIPRIENVSRLKKLEYLNLALNNVERIENLEGCESLQKLDLTVNFVGQLTDVERLKNNIHLTELYLTGNPCTDYDGYRQYVIATLPQLKHLDGEEISKSERIEAIQNLAIIRPRILEEQATYQKKREKQRNEAINANKLGSDGYEGNSSGDHCNVPVETKILEEDEEQKFWEEKLPFTPESRILVHEHMQEKRRKDKGEAPDTEKIERKLFKDDGRPFNLNEPKVKFILTEDEEKFVLDVSVFKHMDTSLCELDIQPNYVRVTIKGKILQLALTADVMVDNSSACRSRASGHLVVTMPKVKGLLKSTKTDKPMKPKSGKVVPSNDSLTEQSRASTGTYERLDIEGPPSSLLTELANIVQSKDTAVSWHKKPKAATEERPNSKDFVDDLSVPPLI